MTKQENPTVPCQQESQENPVSETPTTPKKLQPLEPELPTKPPTETPPLTENLCKNCDYDLENECMICMPLGFSSLAKNCKHHKEAKCVDIEYLFKCMHLIDDSIHGKPDTKAPPKSNKPKKRNPSNPPGERKFVIVSDE